MAYSEASIFFIPLYYIILYNRTVTSKMNTVYSKRFQMLFIYFLFKEIKMSYTNTMR